MGVDHTSASLDDENQIGSNGSCSARGFHCETGRRMYDAFSVKRKKFGARKSLHLVVCALVAKGQSILLRT